MPECASLSLFQVAPTHYAPVADLFHQQKLQADRISWKSKPSWYVLATQDHTVHPDLQRWVSRRMNATVTQVDSGHVPMLSQPDVVIDVIRKAAARRPPSPTLAGGD